jgi:hypothetical protein
MGSLSAPIGTPPRCRFLYSPQRIARVTSGSSALTADLQTKRGSTSNRRTSSDDPDGAEGNLVATAPTCRSEQNLLPDAPSLAIPRR